MFFVEERMTLMNEWIKEFKDFFSISENGELRSDVLCKLEELVGSGIYRYEGNKEDTRETQELYSFVKIFKNHPESSIIWSAMELLLFGKKITYTENGEQMEHNTNNVRVLYELLKSQKRDQDIRVGLLANTIKTSLVSSDSVAEFEKNAFIDDAIYFFVKALNVSSSVDCGNNNAPERRFKQVKNGGVESLNNYKQFEDVWTRLYAYFKEFLEYQNKIDDVLNFEASVKEKEALFKDERMVTLPEDVDCFISQVLLVLDFGIRNCAVCDMFKLLDNKTVTGFHNQYRRNRLSKQALDTRYAGKDAKNLLNDSLPNVDEILGKYSDESEQGQEFSINIKDAKAVRNKLAEAYDNLNRLIERNEADLKTIRTAELKDILKKANEEAGAVQNELFNRRKSVENLIEKAEQKEKKETIAKKKDALIAAIDASRNEIKRFPKEKLAFIFSQEIANKTIESIQKSIKTFQDYIDGKDEYAREIVTEDNKKEIEEIIKYYNTNIEKIRKKVENEHLPHTIPKGTKLVGKSRQETITTADGSKVDVLFDLLDEDFNELLFSEDEAEATSRYRNYNAYHKLVDAAVDVKKQPMFSDYKDITKYDYFKPFSYQVDSVRTMLSRFEGRGVFGDQVGLGKTLQTLMTADAIKQCGAIRNAVIVVSKTNIDQWRREAETKFRDENGEEMFDVYPKADEIGTGVKEGKYYNFDGLMNALKRDEKSSGDKLKIYFISMQSLTASNSNGIDRIKKSNETSDLEIMANRSFEPSSLPSDFDVFDFDISQEKCLEKLFYMATMLYKKYVDGTTAAVIAFAGEIALLGGKEKDGGLFEWDSDTEWKIGHVQAGVNDELHTLDKTKPFNERLEKIRERINEVKGELKKGLKESVYAQKRLIDLLIVDEVQELLVSGKKNTENLGTAKIVQDFIAKLQKKYCILISATPIRNDLSDIFNLLYMVDKNRLGDTREEAERRFYSTYCEGCRSLGEMAKDGSKKKFKALNGLINSMFTRKRLYDPDVTESMRRHTATDKERDIAISKNRNDYGGAKFVRLAQALGKYHQIKRDSDDLDANMDNELLELRKEQFPKEDFNISDETFLRAIKNLSGSVDMSADFAKARIQMMLREVLPSNDINICQKFVAYYNELLNLESQGKDTSTVKSLCDILCGCINKGFLDFYRTKHDFSTVFLSDYIDWTRPVKKGVELNCPSEEYRLNLFADALVPNDDEFVEQSELVKKGSSGKTVDNSLVLALQTGKILVFEKTTEGRRSLYRRLSNAKYSFGEPRRVYVNIMDADIRDNKYTKDELIDLCYFKGSIYNEIVAKGNNITEKERRYLDIWSANGKMKGAENNEDSDDMGIFGQSDKTLSAVEKSHRNANFKMFSKFDIKGGNWNSVYVIDSTQRAGTDLNAANMLVINQLDASDSNYKGYLDPLDFEQLIGRISRVGQTEECIIFTCLYNGNDASNNQEFNRLYYDILADEKGFNLFGACQTEVSFVVPVVMACMRRMFDKENSYLESEIQGDKFKSDLSEFKVVFKKKHIPIPNNVEKFPQMLDYVYKNRNEMSIYYTKLDEKEDDSVIVEEKIFEEGKAIQAIKLMVQIYADLLGHKSEEDSKKDR